MLEEQSFLGADPRAQNPTMNIMERKQELCVNEKGHIQPIHLEFVATQALDDLHTYITGRAPTKDELVLALRASKIKLLAQYALDVIKTCEGQTDDEEQLQKVLQEVKEQLDVATAYHAWYLKHKKIATKEELHVDLETRKEELFYKCTDAIAWYTDLVLKKKKFVHLFDKN